MGSCVSLLLFAVLFVYILARGVSLATKMPDIRSSEEAIDFEELEPVSLKDHYFDVMFGFFKDGKFQYVPSKYGRFEASRYKGRGRKTTQTFEI